MSEDVPDLADEGEEEFYFVVDSVPDSEIIHFLPDVEDLPDEELQDSDEVPKEYGVSGSNVVSALESDEIRSFRLANYRDIRDAGAYLDKVLFDIDNDQDMDAHDIRNRLTEAYRSINQAKERVDNFEPDATSIIYSDDTRELFLDYLETLEKKIMYAGWETGVNVSREYENMEEGSFDAYTALEPHEIRTSISADEASDTKNPAD